MRRDEALLSLGEYAADQHGLVTTAQARDMGVSNVNLLRLAQAGHLIKVGHGVYQMSSSADSPHLAVRVAWLRLDPARPAWERLSSDTWGGVVSHASAAQVHEVGDVPVEHVELFTPTERTTRDEDVRLRTAALTEDDVAVVQGLPVTTVARTVCDLLAAHVDGGHVGGVIADAEQRDLIDLSDLAERITPHASSYGFPGLNGSQVVEHLVQQAGRRLGAHVRNEQMHDVAALSSAMGAMAGSLSEKFDLPYPEVASALQQSLNAQLQAGLELGALANTPELRRARNALAHGMPKISPDLLAALSQSLPALPQIDLTKMLSAANLPAFPLRQWDQITQSSTSDSGGDEARDGA